MNSLSCYICRTRHGEGNCHLRFPKVEHSRFSEACWSCLLPIKAHEDATLLGKHCSLAAAGVVVELCMYVWRKKEVRALIGETVQGLAGDDFKNELAYAKWLGVLSTSAPFTNGALVALAVIDRADGQAGWGGQGLRQSGRGPGR